MRGAAVLLVGNDQYRLGGAAGAGTSPSAIEPVGALAALRALVRIAAGGDPRHRPLRVPPASRQPAR